MACIGGSKPVSMKRILLEQGLYAPSICASGLSAHTRVA